MVELKAMCAAQVSAECATLCVIDDCLDSDVPLLEISLSDLLLDQVCSSFRYVRVITAILSFFL